MELLDNNLWWHGPKFLRDTTNPWSSVQESLEPKETPPEEDSPTSVEVHLTLQPKYDWDIIYRYSSALKLMRIMSYCLRFIVRVSKPVLIKRLLQKQTDLDKSQRVGISNNYHYNDNEMEDVSNLTNYNYSEGGERSILNKSFMKLEQIQFFNTVSPAELIRSRALIIYMHQEIHFSSIKEYIKKGKKLPKACRLMKLNPFIDDLLIRVNGRLANTQLPHDNKYPLLLHPNDYSIG